MSWSCASFEAIAGLLESRAGFRLKSDPSSGHEHLLKEQMHQAQLSSPEEYLVLLERQRSAFDDLVDAAMVGETFFFRHIEQFERIRNTILPAIRKRSGDSHVVRVWSAACSTGEEPYSLAILLRQAGLENRSRILATDISRTALEKAERGVYRRWSLRGSGVTWVLPYLRAEGDRYVLADSIRSSVQFSKLNLAEACYPNPATGLGQLDLILCRNVMIYFGYETIASLAARLFETLAPGGFLLTAAADPPIESYAPFQKEMFDDVIVYRRPEPGEVPITNGSWMTEPLPRRSEWGSGTVLSAPSVSDAVPNPEFPSRCEPAPEPSSPPQPALPVLNSIESAPVRKSIDSDPALPPEPREPEERGADNAFANGNYEDAARITEQLLDDEAAAVLHVRSLANLSSERADEASEALLNRHPLSAELHYLRAMILMGLGRDEASEEMLRKFAYLEPQAPLAHFSLAVLRQCQGDSSGAYRSYQQVCTACSSLPTDAPIPFSPGETARSLADAAQVQLRLLASDSSNNLNESSRNIVYS